MPQTLYALCTRSSPHCELGAIWGRARQRGTTLLRWRREPASTPPVAGCSIVLVAHVYYAQIRSKTSQSDAHAHHEQLAVWDFGSTYDAYDSAAQRQIAKHIDARLGKKSATLGNLPGPFEPLTMERIVNELWRKATEASKTPSGERQIKLGKEKFAETVKSFVQNWWNNDQVVRGMKKAAREQYAGKLASR